MSIIQWNARGYHSRYTDLIRLLDIYNPNIVTIQESMLGPRVPRPPRGYSIEAFSPTGRAVPGDGLVILIKHATGYSTLNINTNLQALAIRVHLGRLYTICNLYISPNQVITKQQLTQLIDQLPPPYILLGDINGKHPLWGNTQRDNTGDIVEDIISTTDACILNTGEPTHFHIQTSASSAIDVSICSSDVIANLTWNVVDDTYGSDHYPIIIREAEEVEAPNVKRLILKKANWSLYKLLTTTELTADSDTVDEDVERFNELVASATEHAIPRTKGTTPRRRNPWWNEDCSSANLERKRALRRYKRSNLIADRISLRRATAKAINIKNKAKKDSWNEYISTINSDTPMSKIWARVNKMSGKYPAHHPPCLEIGGVTVSDAADVADALGEHYATISSNDSYSPRFQQIKTQQEARHLNFQTNERYPYNDCITMTELEGTIKQVKKSAPGNDEIHYEMIKNLHDTALTFLLTIFNRVWQTKVYPSQWRDATVLSFHKRGKPSSEASSYRPIALTSCVGKLMEKIVNIRLMKYLETNDFISPIQFGFRRMRSTTDALVRLHSDVLTAFENKEQAVCVLFDMQKAYDTAWRYGILKTLHDWNLRGEIAHYISNFLSYRTFRTKIGQTLSRQFNQNEGVPQGSVLSCTLFMVAINGVVARLPRGVKASLYVDDLMIYSTSNYIPALERRMQIAINIISEWTSTHGFTISQPKTVALQFHQKRGIQPEPSLFLDGRPILFKAEARFLGLILDGKCSWKPHIAQLKTECMQRMNLLKALSRKAWGADRTTLLRLYRAIIRPKLDYGCVVYSSAKNHVIQTLNPVHNLAIRLATRAFRSSPVESLYAESGEPPLHIRREQLSLQYFVRTKQLPQSPAHQAAHQPAGNRNQPTLSNRISALTEELGTNEMHVSPANMTLTPIWRLRSDMLCSGMSYPGKENIDPTNLRALFLDHVFTHHREDYHIYTDGSKDGDRVGSAAISDHSRILRTLAGDSSIFTAELQALLDSLSIVRNANANRCTIFSDSKAALQAIHRYNNAHPIVSEITQWLVLLATRHKQVTFCWVPGHIGAEGNEVADMCAKEAANYDVLPYNRELPHKDYYPMIKRKMFEKWQREWSSNDNNKLRQIKHTIAPWKSANQSNIRSSMILTRLRIGHTALTHGHLMERRNAPYCLDCLVPLTVIHMLVECPSTYDIRRRFYPALPEANPARAIADILAEREGNNYDFDKLVRYLKELNIYNKM